MNNIEDDIKSIKTDCHIIRVLLFIIIGGFIGYVWSGQSAKPKTDSTRYDSRYNSNYNTLDNPADRGADKSPAPADSITAFLDNGAVLQPD